MKYIRPDLMTKQQQRQFLGLLIEEACIKYGVTLTDFLSQRQAKTTVRARHEFFWNARRVTLASNIEIGLAAGGRHHATVLRGARCHERLFPVAGILATGKARP